MTSDTTALVPVRQDDLVEISRPNSMIDAVKSLPTAQKIKVLALITSYTSDKQVRADDYVDKALRLVGWVQHDVQLVNKQTGEVTDHVRTIIKVDSVDGEPVKPFLIGFISSAAERFFGPNGTARAFEGDDLMRYGKPLLQEPFPLMIHRVSLPLGTTYSFQILDSEYAEDEE